MSKVHQLDGEFPIVKGCPPTAKLPSNPHLVDTLRAGPTSPSTSESGTFFDLHPLTRDEKAFRNALLWVDQFCFLTGSASADLEPCYVVHPVRGSDEANVDRRKEVEDLLSDAGFNYGDKFRFDALFNGILLEASLHCQWATYASFCFVPPLPVARVLLDALKAVNEVWTSLVKADPTAVRPTLPKFSFPWTVLVLNPRALLPHGKPLTVLANPSLICGGSSESQVDHQGDNPLWEQWTLAPSADPESSSSLLWDRTRTRTLTIEHASLRERGAELSLWAMLLNAEDKLRYAHENYTRTPEIQQYWPVLKEIVRLLFWSPVARTQTSTQPGVFTASVSKSLHDGDTATIPNSTGAGPGPLHIDLPALTESLVQSIPLNNPVEGSAPDSGSVSVIDPSSDFDSEAGSEGLSDLEFRSAVTTARDPRTGADERLDAVKLVLFGRRGYETPLLSTDF